MILGEASSHSETVAAVRHAFLESTAGDDEFCLSTEARGDGASPLVWGEAIIGWGDRWGDKIRNGEVGDEEPMPCQESFLPS